MDFSFCRNFSSEAVPASVNLVALFMITRVTRNKTPKKKCYLRRFMNIHLHLKSSFFIGLFEDIPWLDLFQEKLVVSFKRAGNFHLPPLFNAAFPGEKSKH